MEATTADTTQTAITSADRELGYRLGAVMLKCFGGDGGAAIRAIDESGLTFTQMKVLLTVAGEQSDEGAPAQKLVAEKLGLSLASASRAVDDLVRQGLVARTEDERDRRMRRLTPTAEGQGLADRVLAARLEGLGHFAASLSEHERELLEPALALLLEREEIAEIYRKYRRAATP
jgi:DNA-binding MarR family transcriptional regulator